MHNVLKETRYTIMEAAKKSRMSQAWWRKAILEKKVRVIRIGGRIFVPESTMMNICRVE